MAKKPEKTINISITPTSFASIFGKFKGEEQKYDFSQLIDLRKLLSNEKAKILYTIKNQKPISLYHLAKSLNRDFKSVRQDISILEKFGLIKLEKIKKGKRESLKPVLAINSLNIQFEI